MVAAVLGFLNEHLKLVSQGKEIEAEEAARIAADAALQKAIDAVSLRIDRLVGNNASQAIDNFNEILAFLDGLKAVSYTHLDVYKRQLPVWPSLHRPRQNGTGLKTCP